MNEEDRAAHPFIGLVALIQVYPVPWSIYRTDISKVDPKPLYDVEDASGRPFLRSVSVDKREILDSIVWLVNHLFRTHQPEEKP